jgi:hypothetical protein
MKNFGGKAIPKWLFGRHGRITLRQICRDTVNVESGQNWLI